MRAVVQIGGVHLRPIGDILRGLRARLGGELNKNKGHIQVARR